MAVRVRRVALIGAGGVMHNGFGTVATIRSSDFTFQSNRCGTWSRVD